MRGGDGNVPGETLPAEGRDIDPDDIEARNPRSLYVRDGAIGAVLGGCYGAGLAWAAAGDMGLRSLALFGIGPLAGSALALELRSRSAWDARGLPWALTRYALSFASTAALVYGAGSWFLYPWSWRGCLAAIGLAAAAGLTLRIALTRRSDFR